MRCFIYRNLHKPGHTYSVKSLEGEYKGQVIGYAQSMIIKDASLIVREAGRQRVIETGHKNVHAGIVGTIVAARGYEERHPCALTFDDQYYNVPVAQPHIIVKYNPYVAPTFYNAKTKEPVHNAGLICLWGSLIEAYDLDSSEG